MLHVLALEPWRRLDYGADIGRMAVGATVRQIHGDDAVAGLPDIADDTVMPAFYAFGHASDALRQAAREEGWQGMSQSFYRRSTELAPQPFTGMLRAVDQHAIRHESAIAAYAKEGLPQPEDHAFNARAMRAVERILVGIERFWDTTPPAAMSIKEMMARFEATRAKAAVYIDPQRKQATQEIRAASSLEGDDD
ncbi:hypothetical protein [Bosea massiliensis]|uniref:Uncharacterized protein n=1 Tax=Bosea massiliensis TaxID=151419 RepID=A0ABW0P9L3_9HYPH